MKILQRYIIKNILYANLMIMAILLGLIFLITFLGEFQDIGRSDYNFIQALIYILYRLPHQLYLFSPMMILLGGIIGLGFLSANQELMVIRSSGFSVNQILLAIFYSAICLVLFMLIMGEVFAPTLDHKAAIRKQNAINGGQVLATSSGLWLHQGNNFFHIDRVVGRDHLEGVTRYEFNSRHQLINAYHAETMDYKQNVWVINGLVKTHFLPNFETETHQDSMMIWDIALNPSLLNIGLVEPEELSLKALREFSHHLTKNGLHALPFQLAFWQRLFQPFTIILMLFLALPFVLNFHRNRNLGLRIFLGIILGLVFYLCNALIGQIGIVFQFSPIWVAMVPILMFSVIMFLVFRRI